MLSFLTAGESHGKCLTAILVGVPANLPLLASDIDNELKRRQSGYGRGGRMKIESDRVEITAGVRDGVTLGSPVSLTIQNRDWENWQKVMSPDPGAVTDKETVTRPRPGHADLAGGIKYNHKDLRNVLERASARETAARVALGAVAKRLLREFGIDIISFVVEIGGVRVNPKYLDIDSITEEKRRTLDNSPLRCPDSEAEQKMMRAIDDAGKNGDTLGGIVEIIAAGVPVGLGTYAQWDRRLDTRLAGAIMGIPAIKGVEIGLGFEVAKRLGSQVHDEIRYDNTEKQFYRTTNNAGGIEGGISNGEPIIVRAAMKPIPSLRRPLQSVDFISKKPFEATKERADVCAVPAAGVVAEAVVAIELANAMIEKFGGDSLNEMRKNYETYAEYVYKL
ncbi:TPA: chorismate synthase [Candidatus Poribacteria bacterium]|nr:chorismate synthase [Candidatus Poribacteria bacterium]